MRTVTSLDGIWRFVVDQNPKYHLDPVTCPLPFNARTDVCRRHWKEGNLGPDTPKKAD
ncbi:MAG: hypothetical protein J6A76_01025 [Oscillospiraceae bacterium]|nr:hypothetical protein [Oscillospiraceae bacterium]